MRALAVALAVTGTVVIGGCSEDQTLSAAIATPTACESGRFTEHGSANADWVEFVRLHGVMYVEPRYLQLPRGRVSAADLGPVVARVKCTLATSNIAAKGPLRDGDASFVEAGSSVYEVRGYSAACRIAAKQNGKLTLFYATKSGDDRVTATCALNRGQGKH